jgi:hypothetical protein
MLVEVPNTILSKVLTETCGSIVYMFHVLHHMREHIEVLLHAKRHAEVEVELGWRKLGQIGLYAFAKQRQSTSGLRDGVASIVPVNVTPAIPSRKSVMSHNQFLAPVTAAQAARSAECVFISGCSISPDLEANLEWEGEEMRHCGSVK